MRNDIRRCISSDIFNIFADCKWKSEWIENELSLRITHMFRANWRNKCLGDFVCHAQCSPLLPLSLHRNMIKSGLVRRFVCTRLIASFNETFVIREGAYIWICRSVLFFLSSFHLTILHREWFATLAWFVWSVALLFSHCGVPASYAVAIVAAAGIIVISSRSIKMLLFNCWTGNEK